MLNNKDVRVQYNLKNVELLGRQQLKILEQILGSNSMP